MADFSVILQSPEVRAIVQTNALERAFHDALFPLQLFRAEAAPMPWPEGVGDTYIHSAPGLIAPNMKPLAPGVDPTPKSYALEQWESQLRQYSDTIDTHIPTSRQAIVDLFMRNAHQLAMQAAQSMNRVVRNKLYNAAESGWTVCDGAQTAVTTLRVKRLNGFTTSRNPSSVAGSRVRFAAVSSTNPLTVTIEGVGSASVIGYTPDNTDPFGDYGPGTLTLSAAVTVADRAYVKASDASVVTRVGGGNKVDDVGATDLPRLSDVRTVVSNFWKNNVPTHPDGLFHCHMDPESNAKVFDDTEFQRLLTGCPDHFTYKQFALGMMLNTVFVRNSECPSPQTVGDGTVGAGFTVDDPFAGEMYNNGNASTGLEMHRMLFTAAGGIVEMFQPQDSYVNEAGIVGKQSYTNVVNNGIEVYSDRILMVIRAPLNRLQDQVSCTWKFLGDWPLRTDAATGGAARFKRFGLIISG